MDYLSITRHHEIHAGHRVHGHEGKCAHLHGHSYGFDLTVCGVQDSIGRIIDFSVIKSKICEWLENNWDHKFIIWDKDPMSRYLLDIDKEGTVMVPFNPTAENMAMYLVEVIGPLLLGETDTILTEVTVYETSKCSATFRKENPPL